MARRRPAGRGSTYERAGAGEQLVVDGHKHRRWASTQDEAETLLDRMRDGPCPACVPTS